MAVTPWARTALLAGCIAVAAAAPGMARDTPALAADWPEKYWNPKPSADDFVLPMPCGGAMAFREVPTPHGSGLLDDRYLEIGEESDAFNYLRGRRYVYLSGPFPFEPEGVRGYYVAKYELAQFQYDVVMARAGEHDQPCEEPRRRDFVAAGGLSWFDAVAFGRAYTEWLLDHAPLSLPVIDGMTGFVRAPTEAEWEYAARGGAAVDPAAFRDRVFPTGGDPLNTFAATAGAGSANGKVQPIGSRSPNPLGLHDVYGNVAELVFEPFRLTRMGRLHGQVGGAVKKGGDARTPEGLISSGARQEIPFFDPRSQRAFADRFTGLRVAIAAQAITSGEVEDRLREDFASLARSHLDGELALQEDEAFAALERVARDARVGELAPTLRGIQSRFEAVRAGRAEQAEAAVRGMMLAGAAGCARLDTLVESGRAWAELFAMIKGEVAAFQPTTPAERAHLVRLSEVEIPNAARKGAAIQEEIAANSDVYTSVIDVLTNNYGFDVVEQQMDVLLGEYAQRDLQGLVACLPNLMAHARIRDREGRFVLERWSLDLSAIKDLP